MSEDIIKKLEEYDNQVKNISIQLSNPNLDEEDEYTLKEEYHSIKLEMVQLAKALISGGKNTIQSTSLGEEIIKAKERPVMVKYSTGITALDNYFDGGLEEAQLVMMGGENGAGKTAFALQYLLGISERFRSCFFSFEMPKYKIALRLNKNNPTPNQSQNLHLFDLGRDIADIEVNIKRMSKDGVKFFTIDSLMKITNKALSRSSKNEQVGDITNRLSKLAVENNIILFLIVQISKSDIKDGHMAVKNSGDADYDADIMFFIKKAKDDNAVRSFLCTKNRQNGNQFNQELYFNPMTVSFQEFRPNMYEIEYVSSASQETTIDMPIL